jgi:crotonobetainyl-CoA:carnitine CoA-transferase CaiB-like acyl-CoA transferase
MGQHMAAGALAGAPVPPMTERRITWAVYDVFPTADGEVFVGVVSDQHWQRLCRELPALAALGADPALASNAQRVAARERIMPALRELFGAMRSEALLAACRAAKLPAAPVARPEDLFADPHLRANGSMAETRLGPDLRAAIPMTPVRFGEAAPAFRRDPPRAGEDSEAVLAGLGLSAAEIAALAEAGVVGLDAEAGVGLDSGAEA